MYQGIYRLFYVWDLGITTGGLLMDNSPRLTFYNFLILHDLFRVFPRNSGRHGVVESECTFVLFYEFGGPHKVRSVGNFLLIVRYYQS